MALLKIDEENSDSGRGSLHSAGAENRNQAKRSMSPLVQLLFNAEIACLHGYVESMLSFKDQDQATPDLYDNWYQDPLKIMSAQLDERSVNWDKVVMGPPKVVTFDTNVAPKEVEEVLNDKTGENTAKNCANTFSGNYSSAAQKMMTMMGWKEGEGLGKKKQGRTELIKPSLQVARRGLGYNPLEDEDCLPWWQRKTFEPPTYGGCEHLIEQEIKESMATKAKQAGPGHLD